MPIPKRQIKRVLQLTDQDKANLSNREWRLNNLYWIKNPEGAKVRFKLNWAQSQLLKSLHYLNVILKARQLGFSTFIEIFILDICLFNSNMNAGIIADTLDNAAALLRDKVMFAYNNLIEPLRDALPLVSANTERVEFGNGSSIYVGTSLRGGTVQILHVSELGKIAAKFPEKAEEIRSGAFNTVAAGQIIFVESTAEGQDGLFYEICDEASAHTGSLTKLDFKFHFFPWWMDSKYQLDDEVFIDDKFIRYFLGLELEGIHLTDKQKWWYVKKAKQQKSKMKREFPSTPQESFEVSTEGAYYTEEMIRMKDDGRIGHFPYDPSKLVDTWWDIGQSDATSIGFTQRYGNRIVAIDYYEMSGEKRIQHFVKIMKDRGYRYGKHIMPPDIKAEVWGMERSRIEQLLDAGIKPQLTIPHYIDDGIEAVSDLLDNMCFDEEHCERWLKCLRNYRRLWDDKRGAWKDEPFHNWASHGADMTRYGAVAFKQEAVKVAKDAAPPRGVENMKFNELGDLKRRHRPTDRI